MPILLIEHEDKTEGIFKKAFLEELIQSAKHGVLSPNDTKIFISKLRQESL